MLPKLNVPKNKKLPGDKNKKEKYEKKKSRKKTNVTKTEMQPKLKCHQT